MIYQKITSGGRPVTEKHTGLPVFTRSVDHRIKTAKEILTIGMNSKDAKWFHIQNEVKRAL